MDRWAIGLIVFVAAAVITIGLFGCEGDDDDDDDSSSGQSYGEEIEGIFPVTMEVASDTCDTENEGTTEDWVIEIKQTKNLSHATVYWQAQGVGLEQFKLFKAKVYGNVVMEADVIEEPIGSSECVKFTLKNYYIKVDMETGQLTGKLADEIFYQGGECDSSSQECRLERTLSPNS